MHSFWIHSLQNLEARLSAVNPSMFQLQVKRAPHQRLPKSTQSCKGRRQEAGLSQQQMDQRDTGTLYDICYQFDESDKESHRSDADIFLAMMGSGKV